MAGDWTDAQNDAIVADYFAMLDDDVAGRPYSKAEHNRSLQQVTGRSRGSIEYKHQNISAVLKGLGEEWIPGYKPAFNFQASLVDAVVRWLDRHPDWFARTTRTATIVARSAFQENAVLWIGPPPTYSNAPPPEELEQMIAIARKYDVGARDARNRALGRAGEERILAHERATLLSVGRTDLAHRIRWVMSTGTAQVTTSRVSNPTVEIDSSRSRRRTDGNGRRFTSHATSWRLLIRIATTGGWCDCGISPGTREPSNCAPRLRHMSR